MKKKFFVTAAIAALMGVAGYLRHANATPADGLSDLELANAEALALDPEQHMGFCDTYCSYRYGYICVLTTNHGYNVNCDNMVPWNFSPVE